MEKKYNITSIRRSCITGKAVWIYRGPSKEAEGRAYRRACQREIERVRHWKETAAGIKAGIRAVLDRCMAALRSSAMTPERRAAARRLAAYAEEDPPFDHEFYDHIMEERRRRAEDREIRRRMRERDAQRAAQQNTDYGKQAKGGRP